LIFNIKEVGSELANLSLDALAQKLKLSLWDPKFSTYLDANDPLKSQRENFYIPQIENFQKKSASSKRGELMIVEKSPQCIHYFLPQSTNCL
jgi:hypothetical protein